MTEPDLFRNRLDHLIDLRHPLAVLATRIDWAGIEAKLEPLFEHAPREARTVLDVDLFGESIRVGGGVSDAGRPRLPIRLMVSLLYLRHAFNESDETLCERWAENVVWQFFSGMTFYQPRFPCDPTQIGRFRRVLGEAGVEELLAATIETAVSIDAIKPAEFAEVLIDTTVQEKAIAHPTDSRLLEVARAKVAHLAKRAGLDLKQTYAKEGKRLRRKASGYAHAKQFKRLKPVLRRQRTILGRLIRDVQGKMVVLAPEQQQHLNIWIDRAERIRQQQRKDKGKLYALHAPEVECIAKGKARQPYEFGVKVGIAVTARHNLLVGARSFPGNPYDGHTLHEQLEQSTILLESIGVAPNVASADKGYRGVDAVIAPTRLWHPGKWKSADRQARKLIKRRSAVEPVIGHLKDDHGMRRCWLKGAEGDALHAVLCGAGYNIRWLLRAITRLGIRAVFLRRFLQRYWAALVDGMQSVKRFEASVAS